MSPGRLLMTVGVLALAGGSLLVPSASSLYPADPVIAYVGKYQSQGEIYLINVDGSGQRPLVGGVADRTFSWSPDGLSIAYTAGEHPMRTSYDPSAIRIVSVSGGQTRLLTRAPGRTARDPMVSRRQANRLHWL